MEKTKNKKNLYLDTDLSSHMEDYIETIAMLSEKNRVVRVKDIAKKLNIKMPSVTAALNKLKETSLIEYEKYGYIELTEEGSILAGRIWQRHHCLTEFFHSVLDLDPLEADNVACKLEHHISPGACEKLHKFLEFYKSENKSEMEWINRMKKILK